MEQFFLWLVTCLNIYYREAKSHTRRLDCPVVGRSLVPRQSPGFYFPDIIGRTPWLTGFVPVWFWPRNFSSVKVSKAEFGGRFYWLFMIEMGGKSRRPRFPTHRRFP